MKLLLILVLFLPDLMLAKNTNEKEVDDILDRLEQKLLESKQESLLLNDNWNKPIRKLSTSKKMEFSAKDIPAVLPNQDNLKEIGRAIEKIDVETERLSADMEKLKQIIGNDTQTNSVVEIYLDVVDPSNTSLRDIEINLNRFTIYKLSPNLGIWLPRKRIPIFSGPLSPGEHQLSLNGRIARTISKDLPVDSNAFHIFDQDFKITIPQGNSKKIYSISLDRVDEKNFKAKANLIETTN